jgi:eukaryotic-like serine/threonine-protein kinase
VPNWAEVLGDPGAPPPVPVVPGYISQRLVSEEGQGEVYLARAKSDGALVAIKRWKSSTSRARREEQALLSLDHPNVVRVLDFSKDQELGLPCLVMEYVDAPHLLASRTRLEPVEAAEIIRKVAFALDRVHRTGLVHRDVKPKNILVRDNGEPVLVDFGTVKVCPELAAELDMGTGPATATGDKPLGTFPYMAPEQLGLVSDPVDRMTDVYGLGATLYQCLTGSVPFDSISSFERERRNAWANPVDGADVSGVPPELRDIVGRALAFRPGERHATCFDLAKDLERFLDQHSSRVPARGESSPRARPLLGLAASGALLLLLIGVGSLYLGSQSGSPLQSPLQSPTPVRHAATANVSTRGPQPPAAPVAATTPKRVSGAALGSTVASRTVAPSPPATSPQPGPAPSRASSPSPKPTPTPIAKPSPARVPPLRLLGAQALGPGRVRLDWTGGRGRLKVQRRGPKGFAVIASVSADAQSYLDTNAAPGRLVAYRLEPSSGAASQTVRVKTPVPPPGTPRLEKDRVGVDTLLIRWTHPGVFLSEFELQFKGQSVRRLSASAREFKATGLKPSTAYAYTLRAIGQGGRSGLAARRGQTKPKPPASVGKVSLRSAGSHVEVTWPSTNRASRLYLERALRGKRVLLGPIRADATRYKDETVVSGNAYHYRLVVERPRGRAKGPWKRVELAVRFVSPGGRYAIALAPTRCQVFVRDAKQRWRLSRVHVHKKPVTGSLEAAFRGHVVAIREGTARVRLWDLRGPASDSRLVPLTSGDLRKAFGSTPRPFCTACGAPTPHNCPKINLKAKRKRGVTYAR